MLDLHLNARPDEKFHLQTGQPYPKETRFFIGRQIIWQNLFLENGYQGEFYSTWLFGRSLHWYRGTCKCDSTRTLMYWWGKLDNGKGEKYIPDTTKYVMTTTPKEMFSVRFFTTPSEPTWQNMGNS